MGLIANISKFAVTVVATCVAYPLTSNLLLERRIENKLAVYDEYVRTTAITTFCRCPNMLHSKLPSQGLRTAGWRLQSNLHSRGRSTSKCLNKRTHQQPQPRSIVRSNDENNDAVQSQSINGFKTMEELARNVSNISDTNVLQTALAAALRDEDYQLAAKVRDRMKDVLGNATPRIDWSTLGLEPWIVDRVERLGFRFPSEIQRRAAPVIVSGLDAVVQSETGSGKTLSFLVPVVSSLTYPPDIFLDDLQGPQAVVVVPTMELGVQVALTVYKLFGGNLSQRRPGDPANMFTYNGPRNIRVRGVLNKEEVAMAKSTDYLKGVHVVVGTPRALMDVYSGEDRRPILDHLKVLVIDEYDECVRSCFEATSMLLSCAARNAVSLKKPQVVLVGATLTPDHVTIAAQAGWLKEPVHLKTTDGVTIPAALTHRFVVVPENAKLAVLARLLRKDLEELGDDPMQPARAMVFGNTAEEVANATEPLRSALWGEHQMSVLLPPGTRIPPPPGTLLDEEQLDQDKEEAMQAARHELAGSSPFSASDPIRAMHSFRDNKTSLLLCHPAAARGLDLPAVSHVYSIGCPTDATQYVHRAGRAGRIGSTAGGVVTTIVSEEEVFYFENMMGNLGVTPIEVEPPSGITAGIKDVENFEVQGETADKLRKGLEDLFNLM